MFTITRLYGIGTQTPAEETVAAEIPTIEQAVTAALALSDADTEATDEFYIRDPETGGVFHKYIDGVQVW